MEEKEREKEKFFQDLYELDEQDDCEEINTAALILRTSRKRTASTIVAVTPHAKDNVMRRAPRKGSVHTHITRTISAPLPLVDSPICQEVECVRDSPAAIAPVAVDRQRQIALKLPIKNLRRTTDGGAAQAKEVIKMPAKRKRGKLPQVLPESQQIFKGLQFCTSFAVNLCEAVLTCPSLRAQQ